MQPPRSDVLMKAIQLVCATMEEIILAAGRTNLFRSASLYYSHSQRSVAQNMRMLYRTDEMCEFNFAVPRAHKYASLLLRADLCAITHLSGTDSADRGRSAISQLLGRKGARKKEVKRWKGDIKGPPRKV